MLRLHTAASAGPLGTGDADVEHALGRQIDHAVTEMTLDLEDTPAAALTLRYEYRAVLVRLGVLPAPQPTDDAMDRRERARGFAPGFCPDPKR